MADRNITKLDILRKPKVLNSMMIALIGALSLIRIYDFPESDILWGARNGQETLARGLRIFQPDEWNAVTLGETWSPNSWMWNVLLAISHNTLGVWGFMVITFITMAATLFLIWRITSRYGFPVFYQWVTVISSWVILFLWMNGRANTVTAFMMVLFVYLTVVLRDWLDKRNNTHYYSPWTWRLLAVPLVAFLVSAVWVNLHLTAIIAIALFPVMDYIVFSRIRTLLQSIVLGVGVAGASGLGLGMSPFGFSSLAKVSLVENESKGFFYEWSPLYAGGEINWFIVFSLLFSLVVLVTLVVQFFQRKKRIAVLSSSLGLTRSFPFIPVLVMLVFMYATFDTIRLATFLLGLTLASMSLIVLDKDVPNRVYALIYGVTTVALVAGLTLFALLLSNPYKAIHFNPEGLDNIPEGSVVLTTAKISGGFILYRPDTLILIDGRNDLIGKERYLDVNNILFTDDKQELDEFLNKWDVGAVYVPSHVYEDYPIHDLLEELNWAMVDSDYRTTTWLPPVIADK